MGINLKIDNFVNQNQYNDKSIYLLLFIKEVFSL